MTTSQLVPVSPGRHRFALFCFPSYIVGIQSQIGLEAVADHPKNHPKNRAAGADSY